jgi:NAD(P)-dependent dehydrogenase (short-subunit alcohol dehydrogenase family)
MAEPLSRTEEGWEHQFATNYLGHFGLSLGLHDALAQGAPARIGALTSSGHFWSPVVLDDLQFDRRPYDPWLAYGQAKTAIVLFAVEATRRWAADGITANAVMPGGIRTNLQQYQSGPEWEEIDRTYDWKTVEEGAAPALPERSPKVAYGRAGGLVSQLTLWVSRKPQRKYRVAKVIAAEV